MEATGARRSFFQEIQKFRVVSSPSLMKRLLILAVSLVPCLGPIFLIRFFGTKAIFCDEWGLPYFFQRLREGALLLNILWRANNEHRIVFPRLLFGLVAVTTNWDPRVVMYFSVGFMALSWAIFTWTFVNRFSYLGGRLVLLFALSSLIFFSLAQQQNWLWAFQTAFFLIVGCQLLAVATMLNERVHSATRLCLAALLCAIASFSSAQGLFSWIAVLPLVFSLSNSKRTLWLLIALWFFIASTVCLFYLKGLDLSHSGGLRVVASHPLKVLRFGLVLTGAPFVGPGPANFRIVAACIIGLIIISVSIAGPAAIVCKAGWRAAAVSFCLTLIGIIPLVALSTGRFEDYGNVFFVPRYTTPVIPIALSALIALFILQAEVLRGKKIAHPESRGPDLGVRRLPKILFLSLCGLFFGGYLWNLPDSIAQAVQDSARNQIAAQFNQFSECLHPRIDGIDPPEVEAFGVDIDGLNDRVGMRQLAAGGYRQLVQHPTYVESPTETTGRIDRVTETPRASNGKAKIVLSGYCKVLSWDHFAPFVFVTNRADPRIIGAVYVSALNNPDLDIAILWKVPVSKDLCISPPEEEANLDTWLYDKTKNEFCLVARTAVKDASH